MSTPVSPALVRETFRQLAEVNAVTPEGQGWRGRAGVLADLVRNTAAEMRQAAKEVRAEGLESIGAYRLEELADKLEGIE